ncbi:MAG: peptidylprolyl isomerase [Acidiferrobacterales bacterium]
MKRCIVQTSLLAIALSVCGLVPPALAAIVDIDRIVVVVNEDVITNTELEARIEEIKQELAARNIDPPAESVLRKQVVERMVFERIQLQLADEARVRVNDKDVEQAIARVAERNNRTVEQLYRALRRDGIEIERYRSQIRNDLKIQRLLQREINNRITVSDAELENFLATRDDQDRVDDAYRISQILIAVPNSATPEQVEAAKTKAGEIYESLIAGANFEQAAITHSDGQNALQAGSLGWKKPGQLPGMFLASLLALEPGGVSDVLRSPVGFHILKLDERKRSVQAQPVPQVHVRHILLRPSEVRSISEVRTKLEQLRERVLNGEDFAELARAHSEDKSSTAKGGDLGWVNPGQTVPEFEKGMNELEPNELSEPVETPFGLHLIQVLAKRTHDVSEERSRAAARQQIHTRKADARYDQWLRRRRDEAYVNYRLEDK